MSGYDVALERLVPARTLVLVVDVQERLVAAMPEDGCAAFLRSLDVLLNAATLLGARVAATEQYPKGLGHTVRAVADQLGASATVDEKLTFSAAAVPGVASALAAGDVTTVVVAGMEAHVCVYQTVRDLRRGGVAVQLVSDAVISRKPEDRAAGIALCARAGAVVTTTETVVFDWLERAGTDTFRAVSKLVR